MKRRAVFLDRDGVINAAVRRGGKLYPPPSVDEVVIPAGVAEACQDLRRAGYLLVVVTNQPDVARGTQTRAGVEEINSHIRSLVELDDIRVCYHDDADHCACRKPNPGLLTEAAADWGIDLAASFLVGDRSKDIVAGSRAGCRTVYASVDPPEDPAVRPDHAAADLREAAAWILGFAG